MNRCDRPKLPLTSLRCESLVISTFAINSSDMALKALRQHVVVRDAAHDGLVVRLVAAEPALVNAIPGARVAVEVLLRSATCSAMHWLWLARRNTQNVLSAREVQSSHMRTQSSQCNVLSSPAAGIRNETDAPI